MGEKGIDPGKDAIEPAPSRWERKASLRAPAGSLFSWDRLGGSVGDRYGPDKDSIQPAPTRWERKASTRARFLFSRH